MGSQPSAPGEALQLNPLPTVEGGFGCILADPPWRFSTWSAKGRGRCPDGPASNAAGYYRNNSRVNSPERHYRTMTLDEIKALPVADVAARDCVLVLWAVDPMIPEALDVGRAWGFKYKSTGFVWAKERRTTSRRGADMEEANHKRFPMGTGYWMRANPEVSLLFTRGKPKRLSAGVRKLIVAPRREHSRKPDEVYPGLEELCAGPRLELFARATRPGWSSWGDQVGVMDEAPAAKAPEYVWAPREFVPRKRRALTAA